MIGNEIKYLEAIRRNRNITAAAEELNISQPSLSRYLKDKEAEIGYELFIRDKKSGIQELTEFGKIYFNYAEQILRIEERYEDARISFQKGKKTIRVGMPLMFSNELVDLLVEIRHLNKNVDIQIISDSMCQLKKQASLGLLDYSFVYAFEKNETKRCITSFEITPVCSLELQEKFKDKIRTDEYGRKHIAFKELMGEKFYIPCSCRVVGKAARMIFKEFGTPENVSEWDSTDFAQAAAFKDGGIAFYGYHENQKPKHLFIEKNYTCYIYFAKCNKSCQDIKLP
ncbi:MAG: LysR family transcriptional regulator [Solobacterium sp.]|nr:LysR family transcriptional regulator [Solobacterium sp.]